MPRREVSVPPALATGGCLGVEQFRVVRLFRLPRHGCRRPAVGAEVELRLEWRAVRVCARRTLCCTSSTLR